MNGNTPTSEYGGVAQLGEHLLCKQGVIGSIPFISTSPADGKREGRAVWKHTSGPTESWKREKGSVGNHLSNQEMGL